MPTIGTDERQLVTVEPILALTPIDNADAIEAATVRGWTVVVRKGEFEVGQQVLYFEIDSLLPLEHTDTPATALPGEPYASPFEFLAPRGEKLVDGVRYHRLKTARLRGVYSQGLIMALDYDVFPRLADPCVTFAPGNASQFIASALGVKKYEEEVPEGASGPFPTNLGQKTSSERVQNLVDHWRAVLDNGPWVAVEKVDGKSCSVFCDAEGVLRVCGRNWEVPAPANKGQADVYWRAVEALDPPLEPGEGVQFEVYGEGIAKNPLRVQGEHVAIFNFLLDGIAQPRSQWPRWAMRRAAPVYDLTMPATAAEAIEQVDGIKSLIAPDQLAEGVVWTQVDCRPLPELGYRATAKAVSNKYLAKHGG